MEVMSLEFSVSQVHKQFLLCSMHACIQQHFKSHFTDVIENGQLRLTHGLHKYAGRVEMYWNSEWRTVCYDGWGEFDAQVVCRQLNYLATSIQILGTWN